MELIYYPNHDKRYAHIHESERQLYPDEVRIGHPPLVIVIKRTKLLRELTKKDIRKIAGVIPACILAKDVPYTRALHDG